MRPLRPGRGACPQHLGVSLERGLRSVRRIGAPSQDGGLRHIPVSIGDEVQDRTKLCFVFRCHHCVSPASAPRPPNPRLQFCLLPSSSCVFRLRSRESNIFVPVGPRLLPNSQPLRCPSRTVPPWSKFLFVPSPLTPRGGKKRLCSRLSSSLWETGNPNFSLPFSPPLPCCPGCSGSVLPRPLMLNAPCSFPITSDQ